jgi:DNA-binding response OmpR family regulator
MTTRIVVVDDEPAIGKLLLYQLAGFGYQVSYFQDGLEALQYLPSARADLVILDVMMPLISGWEVCRQIRACSTVPIIMLTAKASDADVVTGLGAGADDYVTKPFSMAQLHARIESVLRRSAPNPGLRALDRAAPRLDAHLAAQATVAPVLSGGTIDETTQLSPSPAAPPAGSSGDEARPAVRIGSYIHDTRVARGLTLHQIERATKIRWEFLQAIEQENWSYLPRPELRRALQGYAGYLHLDLPALTGRPKGRGANMFAPLQFAAVFAVVMVLLVVGMYFF